MNFGIKFLNKLSYPRKMMFISFIMLIPFIISLSFVLSDVNSAIHQAQSEKQGLAYLNQLNKLIIKIAYYEKLKQLLPPESEQLTATQQQVNLLIKDVESLISDNSQSSHNSDEWQTFKQYCLAITETSMQQSGGKYVHEYQTLFDVITRLFDNISHSTGLILDPALNSTLLIEALTTHLPNMTGAIAEVPHLSPQLVKKSLSVSTQNLNLTRLISLLQQHNQLTHLNIEQIIEHNKSTASVLAHLESLRHKATTDLIDLIKTGIFTDQTTKLHTLKQLSSLKGEIISKHHEIINFLNNQTSAIIEQRIDKLNSECNFIIGAISVSFLIAMYFIIALYHSLHFVIQDLEADHWKQNNISVKSQAVPPKKNEIINANDALMLAKNNDAGQPDNPSKNLDSTSNSIASAASEMQNSSQAFKSVQALENTITIVESGLNDSEKDGFSSTKDTTVSTPLFVNDVTIETEQNRQQNQAFSIVAHEQKSLRMSPETSSENIQLMIDALQQKTIEITQLVEQQLDNTESLTNNNSTLALLINNILRHINQASTEAKTANDKQKEMTEQIKRITTHLPDLTLSHAESDINKVYSASQALTNLADKMTRILSTLDDFQTA